MLEIRSLLLEISDGKNARIFKHLYLNAESLRGEYSAGMKVFIRERNPCKFRVKASHRLIRLSGSILMHGMVCNCAFHNFFASFRLSGGSGTATVRASLLLPWPVPAAGLCRGTESREVDSGDVLKGEIIDLWAGEMGQKRGVRACGGKGSAWFKKRY